MLRGIIYNILHFSIAFTVYLLYIISKPSILSFIPQTELEASH